MKNVTEQQMEQIMDVLRTNGFRRVEMIGDQLSYLQPEEFHYIHLNQSRTGFRVSTTGMMLENIQTLENMKYELESMTKVLQKLQNIQKGDVDVA